jgi:hypothetical protein
MCCPSFPCCATDYSHSSLAADLPYPWDVLALSRPGSGIRHLDAAPSLRSPFPQKRESGQDALCRQTAGSVDLASLPGLTTPLQRCETGISGLPADVSPALEKPGTGGGRAGRVTLACLGSFWREEMEQQQLRPQKSFVPGRAGSPLSCRAE